MQKRPLRCSAPSFECRPNVGNATGLMDLMSQHHHRAAALFAIIPPWLGFLETRRLIDAEVREQALDELAPLADRLLQVFDTFPDDSIPRRVVSGI